LFSKNLKFISNGKVFLIMKISHTISYNNILHLRNCNRFRKEVKQSDKDEVIIQSDVKQD